MTFAVPPFAGPGIADGMASGKPLVGRLITIHSVGETSWRMSPMRDQIFGEWREMASAPKDGTRVLVEIRESEQGSAEVDMVRWGRPERAADECWISTESDPGCLITYAESELSSWMPLPTPLPKLRAGRPGSDRGKAGPRDEEFAGSGI